MPDKRDQFVAEISFATDRLEAGTRRAGQVLENFDTISTKVFENFSKVAEENFKRANSQMEKEAREFQKFADRQAKSLDGVQKKIKTGNDIDLASQFGDISGRGQELLGSFLGAAGQVEQFRLTLVTLTGSAEEADKQLAKLQNYANITQFDLQNVVGAGVQLRTLGVDVDRFLPLAGDLASVFNRDIGDAALALGKALSGSQDGIQVLNDSFGITKRELKEAGAAIGEGGAIALETSDDLKKLADAIEKVATNKNFVGAVNQQLTTLKANASQAQDAAFNLAAAVGGALAPAFIPLTQVLTNALNAATDLPKPILALVGGATALATGLALVGGAALTFNTAMGAALPILSKVVPALTGIQIASSGAATGATAVAVAFNPLLAGVTAFVLVCGGALLAFNAMEQGAKDAGDQIAKESKEVASANVEFYNMRDAIAQATGASQDFIYKGEGIAATLEKVQDALKNTSSADFLAALEKGGISFNDLGNQAKEAAAKIDTLENRKAVLQEFVKTGGNLILLDDAAKVTEIGNALKREFGTAQVSIQDAQAKLDHFDRTIAGIKQTSQGLVAPAIKEATPAFVLFTDAAERAKKVAADFRINGDTESLERNNELLAKANKEITTIKSQVSQASGGKLDVGNITQLQDRLTSGGASKQEAEAITGLLAAIETRNKLEKQGADIAEKGTKARVDAAIEDARSLETHQERIKSLQEILRLDGLTAAQKKSINAEITRETKALNQEQKAASKEIIQQAIFEAQSVEGGSQKKIDAINRVLNSYQLEASVRRSLLKEINKLEDDIAKDRKKRAKEEADALAAESQRQQELIIASIDERISKLQQEADAGKNVSAELTAALEERTLKEIALTEEKTKARAAEAKSTKVAEQIEKTGALEVDAARRAGVDAINEQKKAQDERIKKIKEERKEALKAAKDEKAARSDVFSNSGQQQSAPSSPAPSQQKQAPFLNLDQVAAELASVFSKEAGQAAADEVKARRQAKDEDRKIAFEEANPELAFRMADQESKRREQLAKRDADQQKKNADVVAANSKQNDARQAKAQEIVDASRRIDATTRTAGIEGRKLTEDEKKARLAAYSLPGAKPLQVTDPLAKVLEDQKKAGKVNPLSTPAEKAAAQQMSPSQGTSGTITLEVEFKGQQVANAKVKGKSADLDGRVSDIARTGNKISLKVRA